MYGVPDKCIEVIRLCTGTKLLWLRLEMRVVACFVLNPELNTVVFYRLFHIGHFNGLSCKECGKGYLSVPEENVIIITDFSKVFRV